MCSAQTLPKSAEPISSAYLWVMYKSILVAVDGSPRAPLVLEHALAIAERFEATLHLCRAVNIPLSIPVEAWTLSGEELAASLINSARAEIDELAKDVPAARRGASICELGKPAQVIESAAESCDADLVVIGSHGYGPLDRVIGTTAARVVNHAKRPTLVVR